MNLSETLGVARRRKWLLIPLVVLSVALSVAAFLVTPASYEAKSSLVLLAPTQVVEGDTTPVNPFLNFGGSQDTAAQVLQVRMGDDQVHERLEDEGVTGEWTFEIEGSAGPLSVITVEEDSPKAAIRSAAIIAETAQEQFTDMQIQAGSPEAQLINLKAVTTPGTTKTITQARIRNAAAVLALGLALSIGLVFAVEGVSRSRRRAAAADTAAAADDEERTNGASPPWSGDDEGDGRKARTPRAARSRVAAD
jgi:uncharacterized protein involved in exopolysaccharide biosynthesis